MNGDEIPDPHHVMRFVPKKHLIKDGDGNLTGGILPAAFQLKPKDEGRLSVTWLEYFAGAHTEQCTAAVRALRASLKIQSNDGFAVGRIEGIKARCLSRRHRIRVVHAPDDGNKAHAEVLQLPENEAILLEELATGEWSTLVLNSAVTVGANPAPDAAAYQPPQ
jgi:hypothetical protein